MKKRLVNILSLLVTVLTLIGIVACNDSDLPTSNKQWGDDYKVEKTTNVIVDDEVTLDGVLDEDFWVNGKTSCFESTAEYIKEYKNTDGSKDHFTDGSVTIGTYFTDKSLYFGIVVKDSVLYNPGDSLHKESCLEFYISLPKYTTIEHAYEVRFTAGGISRLGRRTANGYTATTASNLGCAVKIDGEGLGSANNVGYTVEGVIDWKDLGLTEKPSAIAIYPNLIRVQDIPTNSDYVYLWHNVAESAAYGNPCTWPVFNENGFATNDSVTPETFTVDADESDWLSAETNKTYQTDKYVEIRENEDGEGKRTYKLRAVYFPGEGLYGFMDVTHLEFSDTLGSWTKSTNVEIRVSTTGDSAGIWKSDAYRAYGTKDTNVGFGKNGFAIKTVEEKGDGYNYRTKAEIFIPEAYLKGVGIDTDAGLITTFAFMPKGNRGENGYSSENELCGFNGGTASHIWQIKNTVITNAGVEQSVRLTADDVEVIAEQNYTGSAITPSVKVTYHNITLKDGEYELSYKDNVNVGTATAILSFFGNGILFTGTVQKEFKIVPATLSETFVTGLFDEYAYTSSGIEPSLKIVMNGITVDESNYTVSYSNNIEIGTATVTVTGRNNLCGEVTKTFNIIQALSTEDVSITVDDDGLVQNGEAVLPNGITVKYEGRTLVENEDYTVTYKNNLNLDMGLNPEIGTATATVTLLKGFGGQSKDVTYTFIKSNISEIGINADPAKLTGDGIYAETTSEELAAYDVNEKKGFGYTAILREENNGGGMYVFAEARLDTLDLTQDKAFRLGVATNKTHQVDCGIRYENFYLTIGNAGQKSGFDIVAVRVVEKDKKTYGYNYQVYYEGFVSYATLSENNVSFDANGGNVAAWETHLKDYTGKIVMAGADYGAAVSDGTNAIKYAGSELKASSHWQITPYIAESNYWLRTDKAKTDGRYEITTLNKLCVTTIGMQGGNKRGDVSRFADKTSITVNAKDTSDPRKAEFTMYYEEGVGLWFNFSAYSSQRASNTTGAWNENPYFSIAFAESEVKGGLIDQARGLKCGGYTNANATGGASIGGTIFGAVGGIYDVKNSVVWYEINLDPDCDAKTKYVARAVGLITEDKLKELKVIDNGTVSVYAVSRYQKGEALFTDNGVFTSALAIWVTNYKTHTIKVTENGAELVAKNS